MDIYYFSGTHWDREWYQNFQSFRYRLVEMTDELLDYMENHPEYETYHFDGQTIVLEDYIKIAPENEHRLKKLIADGRIIIGPWYNMPDEFLVSGESLIRNLMTGYRLSEKWGSKPWKMGYICDIFGHIAQMPQIFAGFGIDMAILGRGTQETDDAFFDWVSPDGSSCVTFRLEPEDGYGSAKALHDADEKRMKEYIDSEIKRSNTDIVILTDGIDHQPVIKSTPEIIDTIKKLYPEANVHHCDLYKAKKQLEGYRFHKKFGELSRTAMKRHSYLHLITYTLSSYYTHKRENDICQNLLEKLIEPMAAFSEAVKFRRSYIRLAYDYLLQNHPHDSICGCSIDQVHKDMIYRFDQVKEISGMLKEEFLYASRPQRGSSGEYVLKIYNTLPFERCETVEAVLPLKKDYPSKYSEPFDYEEIASFKIFDSDGDEIPYQIEAINRNYKKRVHHIESESGEGYQAAFKAKLPPMGYAEYKIVPYEKPSRYLKHMSSGADYMENGLVRVCVMPDGTISIYDKITRKCYEHLLSFVDDGEIGDGWYHVNPVNDTVVCSCQNVKIEKLTEGCARVVFRITKYMDIPEKMLDDISGAKRSEKCILMPIVSEVELSENSRFVKVRMKIGNNAGDHRLRMRIPTKIETDTYFSGQTFYKNVRKTGLDDSTQNYREYAPLEKQTNGIVGKCGADGCGIAFVSCAGLHECAGCTDGDILVTLFRSFSRTVGTMGEIRGQLLGELSYEFLFVPMDKETSYSDLIRMQDDLAMKPIYSVSEVEPDYVPKKESHMCIEGEGLNLSIVKIPEDEAEKSLIVRVYNSSETSVTGKIIFADKIKKAYETNLNEDVKTEVNKGENFIPVSLTGWKLATYKVEFE